MHKITLAVACTVLLGCAASIRPALPAGRMIVPGDILAPCSPDRRGAQSCEAALFNTRVISQVHKGQSRSEVRGIMQHDAERREVGESVESWGYLTSFKSQMVTWITFTDRIVSSISHEIVEAH